MKIIETKVYEFDELRGTLWMKGVNAMRVKVNSNGVFVVFADESAAGKWGRLFSGFLRRQMACFGGYYNAYEIFGFKR